MDDKVFNAWAVIGSIIMALLLVLMVGLANAQLQPAVDVQKLANAIKRTENSVKYPYGVKSINTHGNEVYARKICINSINNALKRYEKTDKKIDFVTFMGLRYSPPDINPNWVRLVKYFYKKEMAK